MLTKIASVAHFGLETVPVAVEVSVSRKGFPGFSIIGLAGKSVDEARERVKAALSNSGIEIPNVKIIVNLAPADLPKEGSSYDLAIGIGILNCLEMVELAEEKAFFYGELSLDGSLRHTKGVLLLALYAKQKGIKRIFVPRESANEAAVVAGVKVYPVGRLLELVEHLNGATEIKAQRLEVDKRREERLVAEFDFGEIMGQESAKRALTIAAAGAHNVHMQGPPGSGKTMLARALAGVLPPLNEEESLEVTKIYSVTGNVPPGGSLIRERPFRLSHHTTSRIGLIGGGSNPHPGEISLAHRGVLFLDEFPEFSRSTLEALRQPMEDGEVSITRAAGSMKFPAEFMLVAASNPCPCGYLGDVKRECKCSPRAIMRYQTKLSGPLMDRIDLHVNVPAVEIEKLMPFTAKASRGKPLKPETSKKIRERVLMARERQRKRFREEKIFTNASMRNKQIKKYCELDYESQLLLKQAVNSYGLSARTYFRLIKVARTIADLAGEKKIMPSHVAEAMQYRVRGGE